VRALIFDGELRLESLSCPVPAAGEALIRVLAAGVCGTDLEITRGYKGFSGVLGHEFVGEVTECEDTSLVGHRVCGEINIGCRQCDWCRSGVQGHCPHRTVVGILNRPGTFAEYLTLPVANLHRVPPQVGDLEAVFVEPLAAALEILEQLDIGEYQRVVVLGDGKLGMLCAQALSAAGANVLLVGRHERKLAIARQLGLRAQPVSGSSASDADLVVEATGSALGLEQAMHMTKPRGTLVMKSTVASPAAVDWSPVVVKELRLIGSRCGPFSRAIEALSADAIRVGPLIEAVYPLEQAIAAIDRAAVPGTLKVILRGP